MDVQEQQASGNGFFDVLILDVYKFGGKNGTPSPIHLPARGQPRSRKVWMKAQIFLADETVYKLLTAERVAVWKPLINFLHCYPMSPSSRPQLDP